MTKYSPQRVKPSFWMRLRTIAYKTLNTHIDMLIFKKMAFIDAKMSFFKEEKESRRGISKMLQVLTHLLSSLPFFPFKDGKSGLNYLIYFLLYFVLYIFIPIYTFFVFN